MGARTSLRRAPKGSASTLGWVTRPAYPAVLGAAVLCYASLGAVLRILPELVEDRAVLGLLVGAPALTAIVTRPGGGRVADRVGPAPVMLAGAALMAVGVVPALASGGTGPLLASRLAVGAGEGAMMSAAVLWLLRLSGPGRQGRALAHIGLANYAGLTAGPLLASALGLAREPVLIVAALLPLAGALLTVGVRAPAAQPAPAQPGGLLAATLIPGIGLMLVNFGYVALLAFGAGAAGTGLVVPVFATLVIAVRMVGASVPDRAGARPTVVVATLVAGAGLAAVAVAGAPVPALAATALVAAGQALAVPALGLLALAGVPGDRHGAAAGLFFAFFDAGVGAGGLVTGGVARATSPAGALAAAGVAVVAAGLLQLRRPALAPSRP